MDSENGLSVEEALDAAGSWGRYQKFILLLSLIASIPDSFLTHHFIFSQHEPLHHCTYPEEYLNYTTNNKTGDLDHKILSTIIPLELNQQNDWVQSECQMYERNYSQYPVELWPEVFTNDNRTVVVGCTAGMSFYPIEDSETVVTEFSMICDDDWKAPLAVSMLQTGIAVGSLFGFTADWYGRRPVFILACVVQVLAQVLTAASWSFAVYCIAITLGGVSGFTNLVVCFVLVTEITDYKWRNFTNLSAFYSYPVGYCILTLIAYFCRPWRWYMGALAALAAIMYVPCCWYFPESPRWLAQKGKSDEAIKCLQRIAKVNGKESELDHKLKANGNQIISKQNISSTGLRDTFHVLFRSGIALRFCVVIYGWFGTAMLYYSISIYSSSFSGDRFSNMAWGSMVEFPSLIIVYFLLRYLGRPRTGLLLMFLCGVSSILLPHVPEDLSWISTTLVLIGRGGTAGVFYLWYLVTCEIVPTLQRNASMSICSATARIGSFCSPYLMYIRKFSYWGPNLFMGVLAIVSGILTILFVPETLGINVPNTLREARLNKRFYGLNICKKFPTKPDEDNDDNKASTRNFTKI